MYICWISDYSYFLIAQKKVCRLAHFHFYLKLFGMCCHADGNCGSSLLNSTLFQGCQCRWRKDLNDTVHIFPDFLQNT